MQGAADTMAARPFLKWPGGKQWLAEWLARAFSSRNPETYFEPFLGGGAVFFALRPSKAALSDVNRELVETYSAVRRDPEMLIRSLRKYRNDPVLFERVRASSPRTRNATAARLIFLNKTAFNGMYRVNRLGQFNVPFGKYENPGICQPDRIRNASRALKTATIGCGDFEGAVSNAKAGDLVYFDPPYVTGHTNNGFLKYNSPLFSWEDQLRLATVAESLRRNGVDVVISAPNHAGVVDLYPKFVCYEAERDSVIGGEGAHRGTISEAVLSSFEIEDLDLSL